MYINCLLSRMAGAYDSCVSIQLHFPFLSACFRVSSSCLGTRTCGTAVHLVPCLTISLLLSIPLSPHLIWDDNQPRSCYHSYIWSPPVVVPLGSQLWFPPVVSSSSSPLFYPLYEESLLTTPAPLCSPQLSMPAIQSHILPTSLITLRPPWKLSF